MEENELIANSWYKIRTTDKASFPGDEYFFKCKEDKKGTSLAHINTRVGVRGGGDLTQSNGSFRGNIYIPCDQSETLWCEKCIKENIFKPFDRKDYQIEPQFDLIF